VASIKTPFVCNTHRGVLASFGTNYSLDPRLAFLCGFVPAMAFISRYKAVTVLHGPLREILPTETPNHLFHRLVLWRFLFLCFLGTGFTVSMLRFAIE
jgi:hypothetical protein